MAKKKNNMLKSVPPTHLTGLPLEHWNIIMPALVADGSVNMLDVPIIESACELYACFQVALMNNKDGDPPQGSIRTYISIMEKYGATAKARQLMKMSEPMTKDHESSDLLKEFNMRKS